jgi:hypothetical protein
MTRKQFLTIGAALTLALSVGYRSHHAAASTVSKIYLVDSVLIRATREISLDFLDVSNPANVVKLKTLSIEGNHDVAVKGKYLYADAWRHLVVCDVSNLAAPVIVDTIKLVFLSYPDDRMMFIDGPLGATGNRGCGCEKYQTVAPTASTGTAGSLARFAVVGDYLYCVDYSNLLVFDVSNPARPQYKNQIAVSWEIETIFSYQSNLFIGGTRGMFIYSIADPKNPAPVSQFVHARSCDPVVVENDTAYVTLRAGSACGGTSNQMDIVSVSSIQSPVLIKTFNLFNPYGLAVKNRIAYVCDGSAGLKILDVSNPAAIKAMATVATVFPLDVIVNDTILYVSTTTGTALFGVGNSSSPNLLSIIQ